MIKKIWNKVRIAVIVILSLTIGSTLTYDYIAYKEIRLQATQTWEAHLQRNADSVQDKPSTDAPKTESLVIPEDEATRKTVSSSSSVEDKIKQAFPECPDVALAVAKAESRLNQYAINKNTNGSEDKGIFQVNTIHGYGDELYDIDTNIQVARKIWEKRQWTAWSAWKNGRYLAFLNN